jgi:hypothetical protein
VIYSEKKYENLYNSVSSNETDMSQILSKIDNNILNCCISKNCYHKHLVSVKSVIDAICKLKRGKQDGTSCYNSNHVINASEKFHVYLSLLLNTILVHGYPPSAFCKGSIIPIPKCTRKSLNDSNNYRAITLSSIICKIMDIVILNENKKVLVTSDVQFGFKPKSSTTHCAFVLDEIINYYNKNGSEVFVLMLDCTKAFDRVHYAKLFNILIEKKLCPVICRFLALLYCNQTLCVKWGNTISKHFKVCNGVKQGGILSPVLFTLYIDKLLNCLKSSGYGCYIGNIFVGAIGYADDIVILSPSLSGLKEMLNICDKYGNDFHVQFNASKYQLMHFTLTGKTIDGIKFKDQYIKTIDKSIYLGIPFNVKDNTAAVSNGTNAFIRSFNAVNRLFYSVHHEVKYNLFKCYCMSLYGCTMWDLQSKAVENFYTQWRKCIRILYNLPSRTHNRFLNVINNEIPVNLQLFRRHIKFVQNIFKCNNKVINVCADLALSGSCSTLCNNMNYISHVLEFDKNIIKQPYFNLNLHIFQFMKNNSVSINDAVKIGNIKDLLLLRDQSNAILNCYEINEILETLCCG